MIVVETEEMTELGSAGVSIVHVWQSWRLSNTQKSHRPMIIILAPSRTICLGASVWRSMVAAVKLLWPESLFCQLCWGIPACLVEKTEMTCRERKARLMARKGREIIKVVGMECEQYDGGADNDGKKRGVINPNCQMILPGTTLEHLS